ncbi:MAG: hypothetical protein AB9M60_06630 [Leptothrix sp. (in: b-proteobacteria)]
MVEPKDPPKSGFLRKVVRFAMHPTTDWADLNGAEVDTKETDQAKIELKAMIERKRRNDFVRKREFDMLRKIRREGLTGEGLEGLEGLSHLDDSEVRSNDGSARADAGVKDKIDAIERQMVGDTSSQSRRGSAVMRSTTPQMSDSFFSATTAPQVMATSMAMADAFKPTTPMQMESELGRGITINTQDGAPSSVMSQGISALSPLHGGYGDSNAFAVEVTELAHDPELDEAVIAFANADYDQCERTLRQLTSASGSRSQHAETWFALFDLYRATGMQTPFDALAMDYVQHFGWSPPQWFSLPKLAAEAASNGKLRKTPAAAANHNPAAPSQAGIGWVAAESIEVDTIAQLRAQLLQMPLPWVLDWRAVRRISPAACLALMRLLGDWADEAVEMRWIGGERFFALLGESAPPNARDADPAYWLLRLEALRLANRAPDFDQAAIDYCLTYEVSPPSWASARCTLRISGNTGVTIAAPMQSVDPSANFHESEPVDEANAHIATVELNGQLVGDIGDLLKGLDAQAGLASVIQVSCARLIRIDFIAAGDLLNWVLARRTENRSVQFIDSHRLVALFCGAMGITEHARVTVRNI